METKIEGFEMLSYLAFCPSKEADLWRDFYKALLAESSVMEILQKIAFIKESMVEHHNSTFIEDGLNKELQGALSLKAGNAVVGMSPQWKLEQDLDSFIFTSMRQSLEPCLERGICDEVLERTTSLSSKDFRTARTSGQRVIRPISLTARA